jgi:hypothetical protein
MPASLPAADATKTIIKAADATKTIIKAAAARRTLRLNRCKKQEKN